MTSLHILRLIERLEASRNYWTGDEWTSFDSQRPIPNLTNQERDLVIQLLFALLKPPDKKENKK